MVAEFQVGDIVRYGRQGAVPWRVTAVLEDGTVSIELVRNPAYFRYRVPARLLSLFRRGR
jgi:hypothetical protein